MAKNRKEGYYWITIKEYPDTKRIIAEYTEYGDVGKEYRRWYMCGSDESIYEDEIIDINENRIIEEDGK